MTASNCALTSDTLQLGSQRLCGAIRPLRRTAGCEGSHFEQHGAAEPAGAPDAFL